MTWSQRDFPGYVRLVRLSGDFSAKDGTDGSPQAVRSPAFRRRLGCELAISSVRSGLHRASADTLVRRISW